MHQFHVYQNLRNPIPGVYLAKRLKERQVGRGRANDDRVGVVPSFHKAPRVAVVGISGARNLVGKLVASEAGVVLLREAERTNMLSVRKHAHAKRVCGQRQPGWYIRLPGKFRASVYEVGKSQNTRVRLCKLLCVEYHL